MTTLRLLPRAALVLAALLASGCAHKNTSEAQPTVTVIEAPAADTASGSPETAPADVAYAAQDAASGTVEAQSDAGAAAST